MKHYAKAKYAMKNVISSFVFQLITLIAGLLIPRYILLYYGSDINGISSTVSQIISYASLLEAGLGLASIQALYTPLAIKDNDAVSGICSATKIFYNKIGTYFSLVIGLTAFIYSFLAKGNVDYFTIVALVIVISLSSIFEYFFHAKYRVLLVADQKLYIISYSQAIGLIISTIVKLILIRCHVNVIYVFLVSSLILLLRIVFIRWYVSSHYPYVSFVAPLNLTAMKQRSALLLHQIAGLAVNSTGGILLSITSDNGLKLASVYAVYNLVYKNIYTLITSAFSNGIVASFGQMVGVESQGNIEKKFRMYELFYYMLISIVYGTLAVMILPFISLYTRGVTDIQYVSVMIAILFTFVEVMNSSRVPCGMMINAFGHFHETKNRALLEAFINFTVTILLVWRFNIFAILVGGLCSYLYRVTDIFLYTNKHILNTSPYLTLHRVLRSWLAITITVIIMRYLLVIHVTSWIEWIAVSVLAISVSGIVTLSINIIYEFKQIVQISNLISHSVLKSSK